jgi:hypothetical protein
VTTLVLSVAVGAAAMHWLDYRAGSTSTSNQGSGPTTHTVVDLPAGAPVALSKPGSAGFDSPVVAISPDGTNVAYVGQSGAGTLLYLRAIATTEVRPVVGSEGAIQAFFSPDGQWIGFLTKDKVKKAPAEVGAPVTLCDARTAVQGWWTQPDRIYFSDNQGRRLSRVSAEGGQPVTIAAEDTIRTGSAWRRTFSDVLPDGKSALVTAKPRGISDDYSEIELVTIDTLQAKTVIRSGYGARYVAPGYLVFARAGGLLGVRFDFKRQEIQGTPVTIADGIRMESLFGQVHAIASNNGLIVYVPGGDHTIGRLAWVDRKGAVEYLNAPPHVYGVVSLSPNGKRLAVHMADVTDYIWIYDIERREGRRLPAAESQG